MAVHLAFVIALRNLGVFVPHRWFCYFASERRECGMKDGVELELVVWLLEGVKDWWE